MAGKHWDYSARSSRFVHWRALRCAVGLDDVGGGLFDDVRADQQRAIVEVASRDVANEGRRQLPQRATDTKNNLAPPPPRIRTSTHIQLIKSYPNSRGQEGGDRAAY